MKTFIPLLFFLLLPAAAWAEADAGEQVKEKLLAARPDLPILSIQESALGGFYAVELEGGQTLYLSADGNYFFAGDLYRIAGAELVNLTENERSERRREVMATLDEKQMLVFSPGERKAQVTVFTDIDCGYCRKLHLEVPELNKMGIAVRYLAYPRAGIGSESYNKIVAAWCADNPRMALTKAKMGQEIEMKSCPNPVADHYRLGGELGVTGTPALILDDGRLVPGYMPATRLAALLGLHP